MEHARTRQRLGAPASRWQTARSAAQTNKPAGKMLAFPVAAASFDKPPKTTKNILNGADGLEFATLINAAMVFQVRKASILRHAGSVTYARRPQIAQKLRAALGLG